MKRLITDPARILRRMSIAATLGMDINYPDAMKHLRKGRIHYITWRTREHEKDFAFLLPQIKKHIEEELEKPHA